MNEVLPDGGQPLTIFGAVESFLRGTGESAEAHLEVIADYLALIPGDLALSTLEEPMSEAWSGCMERDERSFRVISAFWRVIQNAGARHEADVIMLDLGPNLGAINRAALIASDYVVIQLEPDIYSIQGLQNLGPTLRRWRDQWRERVARNPVAELPLPTGNMAPLGYIVLRPIIRYDRPVRMIDRWNAKIPPTYAEAVLDQPPDQAMTLATDPHCLARIKDYSILMPMAREVHKPIFHLKPADGAMASLMDAAIDAYKDYKAIAMKVAARAGLRATGIYDV